MKTIGFWKGRPGEKASELDAISYAVCSLQVNSSQRRQPIVTLTKIYSHQMNKSILIEIKSNKTMKLKKMFEFKLIFNRPTYFKQATQDFVY